jgi:hypothetical protein
VVDLNRLYRNLHSPDYHEVDILHFSDYICKTSKPRNFRLPQRLKPGETLERICNHDGDTQYKLTDKQYNKGHNVGKSIQQNCFVCHKYLKMNGDTTYNQTTFRCCHCKMSLCKKDRTDLESDHLSSCLREHQESYCKVIGCFGADHSYAVFPKKLQLNLLRGGPAAKSGGSRGRWDLVSTNYDEEEEIDGEESDQREGEDDSEQEEEQEEEMTLPVKTARKVQRKSTATSSKKGKRIQL